MNASGDDSSAVIRVPRWMRIVLGFASAGFLAIAGWLVTSATGVVAWLIAGGLVVMAVAGGASAVRGTMSRRTYLMLGS